MALAADNLFFTADLHLGQHNLTRAGKNHCNRPFKDVEHMQEGLIERWNAKVPKGGTVIIIGDVTDSMPALKDFMSRTNGTKHLVAGNHDEDWSFQTFKAVGFARCDIRRTISVKDPDGNFQHGDGGPRVQEIICDHYPLRTWKKKPHGAWHLYGHVHNNFNSHDKSFDVGVDCWNWTPLSYAEVKAEMSHLRTNSRDAVKEKGEK